MQFFTNSNDLSKWVKSFKTPDEASLNIIGIIGRNEEQDIVQTCRSIFENGKDAAEVLFGILSKHNITQLSEVKMNKLVKEAQAVMRTDSLYGNLDMKVCPKLPKQSAGHGLISSYNCRTYCLDGLVFDDDPNRVYCAESIWRRHVADKFSREFKDKDGKWVGGYINERFQTFKDDGGNQMELASGERTRKPRPHQYSTERRLEEARGEKTTDLTASSDKFVKLASVEKIEDKDDPYQIFDDIIEMKQAGISDEDIIFKVAEHYNKNILKVASIHKMATKMLSSHSGIVYAHDNTKITKTAQDDVIDQLLKSLPPVLQEKAKSIWAGNLSEMVAKYLGNRSDLIRDLTLASSKQITKTAQMNSVDGSYVSKNSVNVSDTNGQSILLQMNTEVTKLPIDDPKVVTLQISSGENTGKRVFCDKSNFEYSFSRIDDMVAQKDTMPTINQADPNDTTQEDADDLGLNEEPADDFPIVEK
jgi:hypothetical protein